MRIIFMGTPDFSVVALESLRLAGHEILCVYSQPPRKSGRGQKERNTPIHDYAIKYGWNIRTPKRLKDNEEELVYFKNLQADICVVVAYGLLLPKEILAGTIHGCLNIHGSLLPRWRGASPIQRAIESGDKTSGITIMQMDSGLDTGDILLKSSIEITSETTAGALHDSLSHMGGDLICQALRDYSELTPCKQDESQSNYAHKIRKEETELNFSLLSSYELERKIRAFSPFPATFFHIEENNKRIRIKILSATTENITESTNIDNKLVGSFIDDTSLKILCADNRLLVINKVQKSGKKPMDSKAFLLGMKIPPTQWVIS